MSSHDRQAAAEERLGLARELLDAVCADHYTTGAALFELGARTLNAAGARRPMLLDRIQRRVARVLNL